MPVYTECRKINTENCGKGSTCMTSLEINTINIFYVSVLDLFYGQICLCLAMYTYADINLHLCLSVHVQLKLG